MDEVQTRVQKSVNSMINTLDKECLRKMQYDMYQCSSKCCQNNSYSLDQVQNCIEKCSTKVTSAQTYIQNELQMFQDRLQRCAMGCQDQIRDKVGPNTSENDMNKHKTELEKCVLKCADTHIDLMPGLVKKMKETLNKS
ncbi:protein FAM136A [Patella vulgata]|uniref:protein FAM136A n=1 Tax=Patella vulgata TaxID=6465 RepID=UPI00217FEBE2|nr:protein FAM136A [Patella vulgata]